MLRIEARHVWCEQYVHVWCAHCGCVLRIEARHVWCEQSVHVWCAHSQSYTSEHVFASTCMHTYTNKCIAGVAQHDQNVQMLDVQMFKS